MIVRLNSSHVSSMDLPVMVGWLCVWDGNFVRDGHFVRDSHFVWDGHFHGDRDDDAGLWQKVQTQ